MRERGFSEDATGEAPLCRWTAEGVLLDVMPTDDAVLGFGNPWYKPALMHAQPVEVSPGLVIKVVSAPYFLATKLAAFAGRGVGDYLASHDLEDLVAVIDGRPEIVNEISAAETPLYEHLAGEFSKLLDHRDFIDALPGHLLESDSPPSRLPIVMERIKAITQRK